MRQKKKTCPFQLFDHQCIFPAITKTQMTTTLPLYRQGFMFSMWHFHCGLHNISGEKKTFQVAASLWLPLKKLALLYVFSPVSRSQCFYADLSQLSLRAAAGPIINTLDLWISRGGAGEKCQGCACLVTRLVSKQAARGSRWKAGLLPCQHFWRDGCMLWKYGKVEANHGHHAAANKRLSDSQRADNQYE